MEGLKFLGSIYHFMFFITSCFDHYDCACRDRKELIYKEELSNILVTEFSLWVKHGVKSSADCASHCGRDKKCVSIFYNTQSAVCTAHSVQLSPTEPSMEDTGSMYYSMAVDKTDCADILRNDPDSPDGEYIINPFDGRGPLKVFCDMTTDGGGWTVLLRRKDGSQDFNRVWTDYKKGFGDLGCEFWLGNDAIHRLTAAKPSELRFDMEDWDGQSGYATYNLFSVGEESSNYLLEVSGYHGDVGDSFKYHDGMQFTTSDRDNDAKDEMNCAERYTGGWWYKYCNVLHLTGTYNNTNTAMGVNWLHWRGIHYSLKKVEMKMRGAV